MVPGYLTKKIGLDCASGVLSLLNVTPIMVLFMNVTRKDLMLSQLEVLKPVGLYTPSQWPKKVTEKSNPTTSQIYFAKCGVFHGLKKN